MITQLQPATFSTLSLEQIQQAGGKEMSDLFKVSLDSGTAASIYFAWLGWGNSVNDATIAASDFIDNENDLAGFELILNTVRGIANA
jgi:hypothetical protein